MKADLLEQLEKMLKWKKSKKSYAQTLGITEQEVEDLIKEIRGGSQDTELQEVIDDFTVKINIDKGTRESQALSSFEPRNDQELAELHKVDLSKYKISSYWTKQRGDKFTSSLLCTLKKEDSVEVFQENFQEFLEKYCPSHGTLVRESLEEIKEPVSVIFPKQDAHYNKLDIDGQNNIQRRFAKEQCYIDETLHKISLSNEIEEIVYVVGSDQFNSEWTGLTTKGTPQSNILSYQDAFAAICDHEVVTISKLIAASLDTKILFIPGNHDEYVGWHLIHWLEAYFRDQENIVFDTSIKNTKYHKYGNSALMFNHGDDIKPKDLAHMFPIGFKKKWSECDHYTIFTGDKHTELSMDISGIKFYRIPQLSGATSKWDDKKGYTNSKAEMTTFVVSKDSGVTDIIKKVIA